MLVALLVILAAALVGTVAGARRLAPARIAVHIVTCNGPCSERSDFGALWVSNIRDATVARIDPATNTIAAKSRRRPRDLGRGRLRLFTAALAFGDVWVPVSGETSVLRIHVG
jgi:streptogramin lyase